MAKTDTAFRTISEVSADTGIAAHILRYWETRFPQLRPLQRAGNRRYYRPADIDLVRRIDWLLNREGYTIKGVQALLAADARATEPAPAVPQPEAPPADGGTVRPEWLAEVRAIRDALADALRDDGA